MEATKRTVPVRAEPSIRVDLARHAFGDMGDVAFADIAHHKHGVQIDNGGGHIADPDVVTDFNMTGADNAFEGRVERRSGDVDFHQFDHCLRGIQTRLSAGFLGL